MSKAICGSTSRLIDDDSPFQDRDASVQLPANDIAYWLDWPIYISYWKRCLMPLVIKLIALSGYYCLELAGQPEVVGDYFWRVSNCFLLACCLIVPEDSGGGVWGAGSFSLVVPTDCRQNAHFVNFWAGGLVAFN